MNGKPIGKTTAAIAIIASFFAACDSASPGGNLGDSSNNNTEGPAGAKVPGSSGSSGGGPVTTATGLPCDVSQLLTDKCQVCHASTPKSGAGTSLVTWDDLQKDHEGKKVGDLVKARVHDDKSIMPPRGKLDDASMKILDGWFASGMPKSEGTCRGDPAPPATEPLPCTPDVVIKSAAPYAMPAGKIDQYVCVGFDVTVAQKRHIIAMGPHVDNDKLLHHILLFQTSQAYSPQPTECQAFSSAGGAKLVGGWAPGGTNIILPPEAAFPEQVGTTHWMLQLHYNNAANRPNQSDNSGFALCSTDQLRPNDAGMVAFGSMNFTIPPRASHKIACDTSVGALGLSGVNLFGASPHMHTAGVSMSSERIPNLGTGTPEVIYSQPNFAFENQEHVKVSMKLNTTDIVRTHCGWKNPTDAPISFGENTGDEMCYHFMSYYPDKPGMIWALPSVLAKCSVE